MGPAASHRLPSVVNRPRRGGSFGWPPWGACGCGSFLLPGLPALVGHRSGELRERRRRSVAACVALPWALGGGGDDVRVGEWHDVRRPRHTDPLGEAPAGQPRPRRDRVTPVASFLSPRPSRIRSVPFGASRARCSGVRRGWPAGASPSGSVCYGAREAPRTDGRRARLGPGNRNDPHPQAPHGGHPKDSPRRGRLTTEGSR